MSMRRRLLTYRILIYLVLDILFIQYNFSQTKEELEKEKQKNIEEIEYTNELLRKTQSTRQENIGQIRIINKRISLRDQIITSIQQEIEFTDEEIDEKNTLIEEMENDLIKLRKEYEQLIIFAYRNRSKYDKLMFIFSAENFNQAYKRMRYLQQLTKFRRKQALMIKDMQENITNEIIELENIKEEKEKLVNDKVTENRTLERERNQKNQIVSRLRRKENELKKELEEKKRINERIEREIAAIIEEEARRMRETGLYRTLTPEEKIISDNFIENKGRLPWPTERGIITEYFGQHTHPVLPGITIQNNGIDITTVEGAEARALFDGVVSKVIAILGANYTVIIRHGNFLTVYQNLINVKVKKGDNIKVKQTLGTIYTDKETQTTVLHIEIWKELEKQNPEDWLTNN